LSEQILQYATELDAAHQQCDNLQAELQALVRDSDHDEGVRDHQQQQPQQFTLHPFRVGRVSAAQLQQLVRHFQPQGSRINPLLVSVLHLVVQDADGQQLSLQELDAVVTPPAASTLRQHSQLKGEIRMSRQGRAVHVSVRWILTAARSARRSACWCLWGRS
jgi:hypothetical protein